MTSHGKAKHPKAKRFSYHPFEVTLCGYSGAGKTTLAAKLLARWKEQYRVAYVKHDAHRFEMDTPGKDTFVAMAAGAAAVQINDKNHHAIISTLPYSQFTRSQALIDADFVLAEGFKQSDLPKILLLDREGRAEHEYQAGQFSNVRAIVGPAKLLQFPTDLPYFHRDDVAGIAGFIESLLQEQAKTPLYGLVLIGGQSTRMGRPKWAIDYQGESQALRTAKLLSSVCERVFLSVRHGQEDEGLPEIPRIADQFPAWGPTTGILSAMHEHPQAAWLVAACDLPFLDTATLQNLDRAADPLKLATAYISANDGLPEPLCAIYRPRAAQRFFQAIGSGITCPRKTLIESATQLLDLPNPRALDNANTPEEYEAALQALKGTVHG